MGSTQRSRDTGRGPCTSPNQNSVCGRLLKESLGLRCVSELWVSEVWTLPERVIWSCCWEGSVTVPMGRKDISCLVLKGLSIALNLWPSPSAQFPIYLRAAKAFVSLCANGITVSMCGSACVLCPCPLHCTAGCHGCMPCCWNSWPESGAFSLAHIPLLIIPNVALKKFYVIICLFALDLRRKLPGLMEFAS